MEMKRPPSALRSTLLLSTARILSMALALFLGVLSARYFGASAAKDCYVVAQTIPSLITALLAGGVYTSLLVTLTEIGRREGITGQAAFTRKAAWHMTLFLTPFLLAAVMFPREIIGLVAPGFGEDRLVISGRLLPMTAITALGAVCLIVTRCLFQTRGQFVLPSFVCLIIPLVSLISLVTLVNRVGIFTLAIGPLLGTAMAVTLLALLVRPALQDPKGFLAEPGTPDQRSSQMRRFWLGLLPMSVGANFGQINLLIDNAFASYLPTGTITMLGFAFVIVSNTELLTTLSLAEVAFPRLASAALKGPGELMETLRWSLRHMLLITAPLSAGALTFGLPLVRLLFERGEFGADSTRGVARILACYSLEILFMGFLVLFSRVLFARRRFALVAWSSAGAILANTVLDYLLMTPFGINGIALATTCVAFLHMLMLAPLILREVPALYLPVDIRFIAKVLVSAAFMGGLVMAWAYVFEHQFDTSLEAARVVEVVIGLALGAVSYVGLLHTLHIDEARAVMRRLAASIPLLASR